jgi:hypothetical protein
MDYTTNSPILALRTLQIELGLVKETYDLWYALYDDNIRRKNYNEAKQNLEEVIKINDKIIIIANNGIIIIKQNSSNDNNNTTALENLTNILHHHESKKKLFKREAINTSNIDGQLNISKQSYTNDYLKYIIIIVVGIVVVGLTTKTMITQEESNLDGMVLIIIVSLIVYFLITNLNI